MRKYLYVFVVLVFLFQAGAERTMEKTLNYLTSKKGLVTGQKLDAPGENMMLESLLYTSEPLDCTGELAGPQAKSAGDSKGIIQIPNPTGELPLIKFADLS